MSRGTEPDPGDRRGNEERKMRIGKVFGIGSVAVAVVALAVSVGSAAVMQFTIESYNDANTLSGSDNVMHFRVYAVPVGVTPADDGFVLTYLNVKSSRVAGDVNNPLLGNLSFSLDANWQGTGFSNGTAVDLDGDGDLDVGGTDPNFATGYVTPASIYLAQSIGQYGAKVLVGDGTFTLTDGSAFAGKETVLEVSARVRAGTTSSAKVHKIIVDGVYGSYLGGDISSGPGVVVSFVPEPMTLALLAAGGTALLAFRKRRKVA